MFKDQSKPDFFVGVEKIKEGYNVAVMNSNGTIFCTSAESLESRLNNILESISKGTIVKDSWTETHVEETRKALDGIDAANRNDKAIEILSGRHIRRLGDTSSPELG